MISRLVAPPLDGAWDTSELADWVELSALTSGQFLSGSLQTALARSDAVVGDPAARAGLVWQEIIDRASLCGRNWPLRLKGNRLKTRGHHPNALWHFFLSFLSLGQGVSNEGRRLFEEGVTDVLAGLVGGRALRLGWPRSRGMPQSLDEAVALYARLSREEKSDQPLLGTDKDFGLDIAAWREFSDRRRGGFLPFIGQCATGKKWYEEGKALELQLDMWNRHVHWAVRPVRFFAVPFVVPPVHWIRASNAGGLVLDRPRLLELAMDAPLQRRRAAAILAYCLNQTLSLAA